jgi:hypothetical protein
VGYNALTAVTSGGHNVAVGAYALEGVKLANGNTGVGYDVAPFCVGTNNTFIGQYSGINVTNGSNNIQILNNFVSNQIGVDESNVTRIGNGQTVAYIAGVVTASNGFAAYNTYDLPAFTATGYTNTNAFIVTAALPNGGTNIIKSNSVPALIYGPVNSPGLCEITLGPGCTMTSGSALIKINAFGQ